MIQRSRECGSSRLQLGFPTPQGEKINNCPAKAEGGGAEEVGAGSDVPKPGAQDGGRADKKVAHQIICADHLSAAFGAQ